MQPSQLEIQREVEALRDIRRRSTAQGGPGALILDPDLPSPTSPTSPPSSYWAAASTQQLADGDSSSGSHEDSSSSEERVAASDDPSHLFWVPARLHPEIAPAEFRNFLKEHSRTPPPEDATPVGRSNSFSHASPGLERKRSMLSRQYSPSDNDNIEEEKIVPMQRRRSTLVHTGPQLTINDLQRLEELAEEASTSNDPSKFRAVLRRSLSFNMAPSAIDTIDNIPDMPDEADVPIIVPPPGQILRRSARTKIRKANQAGEDAPHRFGPGRRHRAATTTEQRTSSDLSSNDHTSNDQGESSAQPGRSRAFSMENVVTDEVRISQRPESYSEETSIYDAYIREDTNLDLASLSSLPPMLSLSVSAEEPILPGSDVLEDPVQSQPSLPPSLPELRHPQPQRPVIAPSTEEGIRTDSPDTLTLGSSTEETLVATPSIESSPLGKPSSPIPKKEKDKKGLFGKWGSDKSSKRAGKDRDRERDSQRGDRESGFFGSFFGKKKQDEQGSQGPGYGGTGREAAAALLGASKSSKSYVPSPSPQPGPMGYARYPIHVERAIYRLSHIKLANPRRPLYEQVLISNLMFWYLGVINKTQNQAATQGNQAQSVTAHGPSSPDRESAELRERERQEAEERQRAEKERLEREKQEQEKMKEVQQQQKKEARRGALNKATTGQPGGRRTAEMPVKGPQYEMQHRVMEQEYNTPGYVYCAPLPTPAGGARGNRQPNTSALVQPELTAYAYTGFSYSDGDSQGTLQGTVSAMSMDQSWSASGAVSPPMSRASSSQSIQNGPTQPDAVAAPPQPLQHRSRSPPPQNHNNRYAPVSAGPGRPQGLKGPSRSLSATAVSQTAPPDGKARKVASVHAVPSVVNGRPRASIGTSQPSRGEEEDLPLAVWQQQRRR